MLQSISKKSPNQQNHFSYLLLLLLLISFALPSILFAQSDKSYELKYQENNPNLPQWVQLMYEEEPNVKAVMEAYDAYYKTHPFQKTTYTQYYKRWIRDKWIYVNEEGYYVPPTRAEQEKQLAAYKKRISQAKEKKALNANWEELGPWEYDHEATMNISVQSPGSTHVYTVEQASSNPDIVYAGTANAGLWKSTDKGLSWELMTSDYNINEVYSIAIDHSNENIVYCHASGRIWKSTNGGTTWTETGGGQYFSWTRDLKVHPTNNQILFAATTEGFFRSNNAGTNWSKILGGHFQEIEFHPTNPNTVYIIKQIGNRTEFYKSTDAGLAFNIKPIGWPGIGSTDNTGTFPASQFDGSSHAQFNNVDLGSSSHPDFTIELWVKSNGWSGDPAILSNKNWSSGGNKGFILAANGDGWKFNIGDGSSRIDLNGSSINDNTWHHIAITYEANGDKKTFQDGALIASTNNTISTATESNLALAMAQDGTLNYGYTFPGEIAEVRIWDSALTETEVADWSCQIIDNSHPSFSSLLHYWKMDDGSGNSITDNQGNNNGTISGTNSWTTSNEMTCVQSSLSIGEENKRSEIAVSTAAPDAVYVLSTGAANGTEGLYGFYKSNDAGESFSFTCCGSSPGGIASAANKNIVGYSYELTENGGQYYYDLGLDVSPTDPDKIMAAGISVVRSEDGGTNWTTNAHWVTWVGPNTKSRYTHADVHDVKFFQNGSNVDMWVASDGGLYYSADQGDNLEPRMHGIQGTEFWGFGASYKEDAMIGGTYHNGTLMHYEDTYDKGKNGHGGWFAGGAGDATKGDVHDADGKLMFEGGGMFEVIDRQVYWKWLPFDNTKNANMVATAGQYGNYEWHPNCHNIFYSPVDSVLWRTEDNGITWNMVHDFGVGKIYTVRIPVSDPDIIYVVHNDTNSDRVRLWRTTDGGDNWTEITPSDALTGSNNWRNKIVDIDQDNPDNVWLLLTGGGTGNKVFQSTDGGINWTNLTGSVLNDEVVLDIVHHQGSDGGVYVGTNNTVYYRNNSHSDWQLFNAGLPLITRCGYLHPYYTEGKLRVGTYRGAFQSDLYENAPPTARLSVDKMESNCTRDTFEFKDLSYLDHTGVSWLWTFENGTPATSTEENPKVVFQEGTHDVTLVVTNIYGSSTMNLSDFITVNNGCDPETISGNALSVTGNANSIASTPPSSNLDFGANTDFTISGWIKTTTTVGDATIIGQKDWGSGSNIGWIIAIQSGKLWVNVSDGNSRIDIVPTNLINDDQWHYFAASFDRDANLKVYIDGFEVGNEDISAIGDIDNGLYMVIGADSYANYPIEAEIEEIAIYDQALSQTDIRQKRHLTQTAGTPNLIAYYQFNETVGQALDRTGTNHLSVSNGATRPISSCPIGGGVNAYDNINGATNYSFGVTGVELDFTGVQTLPNDEVYVSRLDLLPFDPLADTEELSCYWIINNYGDPNTELPDSWSFNSPFSDPSTLALNNSTTISLSNRYDNEHLYNWANACGQANVSAGNLGTYQFTNSCSPTLAGQYFIQAPFSFSGKILLEGAYTQNGLMHTNLNIQSLLPLAQPYNIPPYNYNGSELLSTIPANMVDWVLVEVREGTPNLSGNRATVTIETKAGLLLNNGDITDLDGISPIPFSNIQEGQNYHFCIRHRNHLDVLSANPSPTNANSIFDFTTSVNQAFGAQQLKLTFDGYAAMYAADFDGNGTIQITDYDSWRFNPALLQTYSLPDGNLDGVIQTSDYDVWFPNKAKVGSVEIGF